MIGVLQYDKDGKVETPLSAYQPSEEIKSLTARIGQDFNVAYNLQHKPFAEFNDYSLLQRADIDQKRWNAYRAPQSEDIDEAWRWNGIRPITRNRLLGILAQMIARIIIPAPFAQNDKDEIDRMAAQIMRDLLEYNIRNSNYIENYILWITDALVNPAAYLGVGFFEALQTIKEENEGKISKKDVLDGVMSGFQTFNIPLDEILIGNFYQKDLQRQRYCFRRRFIDFDEAQALMGKHKNFNYVRPGIRTVFDAESSMFYDVYDESLQTLVEETTYFNRREDSEILFMNGIYLGDTDPEANSIKHRDNENRPKYNFGVLGFENISSRFFYFKSAAWKLGDDDELVVRIEQLLADATFLETMNPTVTTGIGQLNESIMIPGKNTVLENPDAKIQPIRIGASLSAAMQLLLKKEKDISESSQDPLQSGIQTGVPKTAREAVLLAQNAKINLGRFGNMLANSLRDLGSLMMDVILQHQTVGELVEIGKGESIQKFKTFILSVKENGKEMNKKIVFKPEMMGEEAESEAEILNRSMEILEKEGGIDSDLRIYEVNPEKWRKLKYMITVDVDELLPLSLRDAQNAMKEEMMATQAPVGAGRAIQVNTV